jgi:hypothetical protein
LIDFRDLDEDHFVQFNALMVDLFSNFEACYLHQREGLLEDAIWQRYRSRMTWYLAQPGGRRWWDTWGVSFSKEFSGFVAEEIADADTPGFGLHLNPGTERESDGAA